MILDHETLFPRFWDLRLCFNVVKETKRKIFFCFFFDGEEIPVLRNNRGSQQKEKENMLHPKKSVIRKEPLLSFLNGLLQRRTPLSFSINAFAFATFFLV